MSHIDTHCTERPHSVAQCSMVGGHGDQQNEPQAGNVPFAQPSKGTHTATLLLRDMVTRVWKVGWEGAAEFNFTL